MKGENPNKIPIFVLIIAIILILVTMFVVWRFGTQGLLSVVKWVAIIAFFLIIIGLVIFAVIWLFKKHRVHLINVMKQSVIETCKINSMDYPQILKTKGGAVLGGGHTLGKILGYAVVKGGVKKAFKDNEGGVISVSDSKDIIFIAFYNGGFIKRFLNGYEIFAGVYPDDFQENETFTGDIVNIEDEGRSLTPYLYGFSWCAKHWEKRHVIEETSKNIIYRKLIEYNFNDLRYIIEKAQMVDPKKEEEPSMAEKIGLDKKVGLSLK